MDRISINYFSGLERFESHKLLQTQGCPHLSKTHCNAKYKHQRWNSFLQGHCGLQWCGHGWSSWLLLDFGKHKAAFHNLFVLMSKYFCQGKSHEKSIYFLKNQSCWCIFAVASWMTHAPLHFLWMVSFFILTVYLTTLEMFAKRKLSTSLQEDELA